jgi:GTP-binding protein HflX
MIINAFRATLEELSEASLLLHVVDLSAADAPEQCQTVENILGELGLAEKKRLTVLNKLDRLFQSEPAQDGSGIESVLAGSGMVVDDNTVMISAVRGWGLPRLLEMIAQNVDS